MLVSLQDCIICMEKLAVVSGYSDVTDSKTIGPVAVGRLTKCSHAFHLLCLLAMYCNGNKVPARLPPGERGHLPTVLPRSCCCSAGGPGHPRRQRRAICGPGPVAGWRLAAGGVEVASDP